MSSTSIAVPPEDVAPGDLFTIYRETPPGLPPLIVGELAVLSVTEQASMAKILDSRYTVHIGDRLDPQDLLVAGNVQTLSA